MRITQLVLEKYKRLMLSDIQRFEYNPRNNMQLIIGSNGSGKSSVLEEMTPLPAHHSNFAKGGRKTFAAVHRGVTYNLDSHYQRGSGHHSFIRDGVELNEGGTMAVQKDLVEEHFGLTREIHELLIGLTPFTGLSTAKRREWLTKLTPVDMRYAFNMYNKVRSLHRDQLGVIKHITKRMGRENQDLPDDGEVSRYRQHVKQLTDKLDELYTHRKSDAHSPFTGQRDLEEQLRTRTDRAKRLLAKQPTLPPEWGVSSAEGLTQAIHDANTEYQRRHAVLERMQEEHQQLLQQAPSRDDSLSEEDIARLRQEVEQKNRDVESLAQDLRRYQGHFPLIELPLDRQPTKLLTSVFDEWQTLLQTFPENTEGYFTQDKGKATQERYQKATGERQKLDGQLNGLLTRLARLKGCESVQCPKCDHEFQPGVSERDIKGLEATKEKMTAAIEQLDKQIAEDKQYLDDYEDYVGYVRRFRRLVNESVLFKPLWDVCVEEKVMFRQPRNYTSAAIAWYEAMQTQVAWQHAVQDRDTLAHRLRYVEAIDKQALTQQDQRRKNLETEIDKETQELRHRHRRIKSMEQAQQTLYDYERLLREASGELEAFFADLDKQRDYLFQKAVVDETQATQMQLAQTQETLSKIELREGVLNDLQQQHDEATQAHKDYGILVKALAPTDGLIGRYLMGFMQNVVKMVNAVIAEIWTYPMEVLPSQVEKDELDYKFPLDVNNGAVTAPDISRGSASQRDIVDFAFKLLVMKFMGLEDMPLYLDEFGSTFDEQHRQNLIPFINQMLELNQIDQVFFISHYVTTHGAFNQAEVMVLDPRNVSVPQDYNQHVKLS